MSQNYPSIIAAAGAVASAGGTAIWGAGAVPSKTGAGDFNLTLDQGCDSTQCSVHATARSATFAVATVVHTSDTVKQVLIWDAAGAALDADFDYEIIKAPLS